MFRLVGLTVKNVQFRLKTVSSQLSSLTLAAVGAPLITLEQYLPTFPCLQLPQRLSKLHYVHSLMSSFHLFFSVFLTPFTVTCRIVFAMPEDLEMWPYHLSFRFFTMVRRSTCTPIKWILDSVANLLVRHNAEVSYTITSQGFGSFS